MGLSAGADVREDLDRDGAIRRMQASTMAGRSPVGTVRGSRIRLGRRGSNGDLLDSMI